MKRRGKAHKRITENHVAPTIQKWGEEIPFSIAHILEQEKTGAKWRIVVIEEGRSQNGNFYSAAVLEKAVPLFENSNVFMQKINEGVADHLTKQLRDAFPKGVTGNMVGFLKDVRLEEVNGKKAITADLHIVDDNLKGIMLNLWEAKASDKLGYSIDIEGAISQGKIDGQDSIIVESIEKVNQTDVVNFPSAGGRNIQLLEATDLGRAIQKLREKKDMTREQLAKRVGVEAGTIGDIEDGRIEVPPDDRLKKIATALGVSPEHLRSLIPKTKRSMEAAMNKEALLKFLKEFGGSILEAAGDITSKTESDLRALAGKVIEAVSGHSEAAHPEEGSKEAGLQNALAEIMKLMQAGNAEEAMKKLAEVLASFSAQMAPMREAMKAEATKALKEAKDKKAADTKKKADADRLTESHNDRLAKLEEEYKKTEALLQESRVESAQAKVVARLSESSLPEPMKARIKRVFEGKAPTTDEIKAEIKESEDLAGALSTSGHIVGLGHVASAGRTGMDRITASVLLGLGYKPEKGEDKEFEGVKKMRSLREMYVQMTGDNEVRWTRDASPRITEALTSTFPKVFGDSVRRRLLQLYRGFPQNWRKLAGDPVPVKDFRTQRPIQWGFFDDLSTVAEDGLFTDLADPAEREAPWTPTKRGNLYKITREMVINDDLRRLVAIPRLMAEAANRTLEKFVFDLLINASGGVPNAGTIYTGGALYTAGQANLGTTALSASSLRAARIRIRKQKDEGNKEELGLKGRYLWISLDDEPIAEVLINSELLPGSSNNDINDNKGTLIPIGVPWLRDAGNNDFYVSVAPADNQGLEVGFVNDQEEPEMLVQEDPRVGEVFSRERISWKIRHEYGGGIVDFRSFDGSLVA